ncbi:M20 family metallo-hydrolase [Arthrobacter sp. Soc17.1.1.1]|uniref:M20 family metallo-hydrolase n=1 Tax=Arthrobacter sp. Soc17.1.1.1 TaxID=3121277 RepID=UPI002FE484C6
MTTVPSASVAPDQLAIDGNRLWKFLMDLAEIGAYDDQATGLVGINRQALTDGDREGRRLIILWMEEAGLEVSIDEMGNIFGRREGLEPCLDALMAGSHIDTVATAGAFDGCLGVLGALEVVRSLNDAGIQTRRPIVIAAWTEEEGVRFSTDMLGSAVAAGRLSLDYAYDLADEGGLRFGDELERIGFKGPRPVRLDSPHAYVECHIEQGPVLAQEGYAVGVVTGVQAISWQKVTLHGRAAHAGTTPIGLRIDAGLAAAQIIVEARRMVNSGEYGQLRATVGHIRASPGLPSVVPDLAEITVDLRNPDDTLMAKAEADLEEFFAALPETQPGLRVEARRVARTRAVSFSNEIQDVIDASADTHGFDTMRLTSGAGHDAQEMAAITPTAMIFVRGQYDGISYNPREYSTPEDCAAGISVLAKTMLELSA